MNENTYNAMLALVSYVEKHFKVEEGAQPKFEALVANLIIVTEREAIFSNAKPNYNRQKL